MQNVVRNAEKNVVSQISRYTEIEYEFLSDRMLHVLIIFATHYQNFNRL